MKPTISIHKVREVRMTHTLVTPEDVARPAFSSLSVRCIGEGDDYCVDLFGPEPGGIRVRNSDSNDDEGTLSELRGIEHSVFQVSDDLVARALTDWPLSRAEMRNLAGQLLDARADVARGGALLADAVEANGRMSQANQQFRSLLARAFSHAMADDVGAIREMRADIETALTGASLVDLRD